MGLFDPRLFVKGVLSCDFKSGKGFIVNEGKLIALIKRVTEILESEPAFLELEGSFNVVGDLHGDITSLMRIFEKIGYPSENNNFLFLGDYVDRGKNSIEVLELLFSLKVLFPTHIYLIKGNHESSDMCSRYGFRAECVERSTENVFNAFVDAFTQLPICAILDGRAFCVHGGISKDIKSRKDLKCLKKCDIPEAGSVLADLIWSDPSESIKEYDESPRILGHLYGSDAVARFIDALDVFTVIRAHEFTENGFESVFDVITVFSSTDYCSQGNNGAILFVPSDAMVDQDIEINTLKPLQKNNKFIPTFPAFIKDSVHMSLSLDVIRLDDLISASVCK